MSQSPAPATPTPARNRSIWFVVLGVALVVLGFLALLDVVAVTLAGTLLIGALLLVGGIFQIIHAFMDRGWRSFLLHLLAGVVYAVAGVLIMDEPVRGSLVITVFLTVMMVVAGAFRIATALRHRDLGGWWLVLIGGLVSVVVGILLYLSLPWSGLWVLGTLIGIELIIAGTGWISLGFGLRAASSPDAPALP